MDRQPQDGGVVAPGDRVRIVARYTNFDGPAWLHRETGVVVKVTAKKVHVKISGLTESVYAVSPQFVERLP